MCDSSGGVRIVAQLWIECNSSDQQCTEALASMRPRMAPQDRDLTPVDDAANEFNVARTSIYRYMRLGQLKRWRRPMDRRTYVDREELRKLLEFKPVEEK